MATIVSFKRSPKSKLPREIIELWRPMNEEEAIKYVNKCGYEKACDFEFSESASGHYEWW